MLDIQFSDARLPVGGAFALLVAEDAPRSDMFTAADAETGGALTRSMEAADFTGARGQSCVLLAPGAFSRIVLVGLGKAAEIDAGAVEGAGSVAAHALSKDTDAVLVIDGVSADLVAYAALGAVLGSYRFDLYHTRREGGVVPKLGTLTLATPDADGAKQAWGPLKAVAEGVYLTRDLVSEPANVLSPVEFKDRAVALRADGVTVEVLDREAMQALGFGALLGVAQGSDNAPYAVIMRWNGGVEGEAPVAFIGKGVTFDSGGISIKPAAGMEEMKTDMGGAATVVGLMAALARGKVAANVVGMIGLVENMLSGSAQRPGDVVRSYSGQTIEVQNTDAEGRLVLADLLWYAQEQFKPKFMVDLATLTGAIVVSLGYERAGLFSNDDELATQIFSAGEASGDLVWRMPMGDAYDKLINCDVADMKNIGGRPGGSITAAQFLKRFVNQTKWAHLDIAGTAWANKSRPGCPKGASGFGVRLLERLVRDHYVG